NVLPPNGRVDRPWRINHDQLRWPEKFSEIKPEQTAGDQDSIDNGVIKDFVFAGGEILLHPRGDKTGRGRHRKKGREWKKVALPSEPPALPPNNDQDRERKDSDDGFCEQAEEKQKQRQQIHQLVSGLVESEVNKDCREK